VVDKNDNLLGIIKRSEVIRKIQERTVTGKRSVMEFMSPDVETIRATQTISRARVKMRALHVRTLPVVGENGQLVGIIGIKDIASHFQTPHRQHAGSMGGEKHSVDLKITDVMNSSPFSVGSETRMRDVLDLMIEKSISTIPVVKDGQPVGIISHADVLELIASFGEREGVFIQISGLEEEDPYVYTTIDSILKRSLEKINRIFKPDVLTIHVHTYNDSGERDREIKYSVALRLNTRKHLFSSKAVGWDIFKAISDGMEHLERQAIRKKDMIVSEHHHR